MSEQTLDLRRSLQLVWRHKVILIVFVLLGLAAGGGLTVLRPTMLTSDALVVFPPSVHDVATQVVVARSDPVLSGVLRTVGQDRSLQALRNTVQASSLTSGIISISAQGRTDAQAERTADAVADSYVAYVSSVKRPGGPVQARILQYALNATGTPLRVRLLVAGGLGALMGLLIGTIVVLASSRRDRRLRERDEIANSIGIPVLTSISVVHPSDAADWARLLEYYQPGPSEAWRLRKALRQLGLTGLNNTDLNPGGGSSLAVLSLSSDPKALALGPQLAVFAASLGIPTTLVVGLPAGCKRHSHAARCLHFIAGAQRGDRGTFGSLLPITITPTSCKGPGSRLSWPSSMARLPASVTRCAPPGRCSVSRRAQ